jgi:hypothetical protein
MGVVTMRIVLEIVAGRHDEDAPVQPHDLDLGLVQPAQHRTRDDLIDAAQRRVGAAEVEHAIERAEQRLISCALNRTVMRNARPMSRTMSITAC